MWKDLTCSLLIFAQTLSHIKHHLEVTFTNSPASHYRKHLPSATEAEPSAWMAADVLRRCIQEFCPSIGSLFNKMS